MKLVYNFFATIGLSIALFGSHVSMSLVLSQTIDSTCFMTNSSGATVNLDQLCESSGENPSSSGVTQLAPSQDPVGTHIQAAEYLAEGELHSAIDAYTQVIQMRPNAADAFFMRGVAYREVGDTQSAISDFERAAQLFQEQGSTNRSLAAQHQIEKLRSGEP